MTQQHIMQCKERRVFAFFWRATFEQPKKGRSVSIWFRTALHAGASEGRMQIVERCGAYGSRFFCTTEAATGRKVTIAVNAKGIFVFSGENFFEPYKKFRWHELENLYYNDCELWLGLKGAKRRHASRPGLPISLPRREPNLGGGSVTVLRARDSSFALLFVCESHSLCRALWAAAVAQHKTYLTKKSRLSQRTTTTTAADAEDSASRAHSPSIIEPSSYGKAAMPAARVADGSAAVSQPSTSSSAPHANAKASPAKTAFKYKEKTAEERAADEEKYHAFVARKRELECLMQEKKQQLRGVLLEEMDETGEVPPEMEIVLAPGEAPPKPKRKIDTEFTLSEALFRSPKADAISQLEGAVEVHKNIVAAAQKLAKDPKTNKSVRKKRQKDLAAAQSRLRGIEFQLAQLKLSASKPDLSAQGFEPTPRSAATQSCPATPRGSVPDLRTDDVTDGERSEYEDDTHNSSSSSSHKERRRPSSVASSSRAGLSSNRFSEASTCSAFSAPLQQGSSQSSLSQQQPSPTALPPRHLPRSLTHQGQLDRPQPPSYENVGYRSSASYHSTYRQANYPTLHEQQQASRQRAKSEHSLHSDAQHSHLHSHADWTPVKVQQRSFMPPAFSAPQPKFVPSPPVQRVQVSRPAPPPGYSTASLDRKALRNRPTASSSPHMEPRRSLVPPRSTPSRDSSPSTQRVTTFPVGTKGHFYETKQPQPASPLLLRAKLPQPPHQQPRFAASLSAPQFPPFQPLPSTFLRHGPALQTRSQLPQDPRMEALLDYYRSQKTTKTATIV